MMEKNKRGWYWLVYRESIAGPKSFNNKALFL